MSAPSVELSHQVITAVDYVVDSFIAGRPIFNPLNQDPTNLKRKIFAAYKTGAKVEMLITPQQLNEARVIDTGMFSDLIAISIRHLVDRFELEMEPQLVHGRQTLHEELGHLTPALSDPGLNRYFLGCHFHVLPISSTYVNIAWGGQAGVEGRFHLDTIVKMFNQSGLHTSPTDKAIIDYLTELGLC